MSVVLFALIKGLNRTKNQQQHQSHVHVTTSFTTTAANSHDTFSVISLFRARLLWPSIRLVRLFPPERQSHLFDQKLKSVWPSIRLRATLPIDKRISVMGTGTCQADDRKPETEKISNILELNHMSTKGVVAILSTFP